MCRGITVEGRTGAGTDRHGPVPFGARDNGDADQTSRHSVVHCARPVAMTRPSVGGRAETA